MLSAWWQERRAAGEFLEVERFGGKQRRVERCCLVGGAEIKVGLEFRRSGLSLGGVRRPGGVVSGGVAAPVWCGGERRYAVSLGCITGKAGGTVKEKERNDMKTV
ncbi:hypothetical protein E2C01_031124 [Portunus trituberculatus]|uniref:Uncharacterized protein n=1 Tax=Portunus trituberculatus TaxID=210409 RepID=A0A5B7EWT7_PORTR|nr:hypothetical protein [Portunus trituberculatus]